MFWSIYRRCLYYIVGRPIALFTGPLMINLNYKSLAIYVHMGECKKVNFNVTSSRVARYTIQVG